MSERQRLFFSHFLIFLAAWTLVIKYIFPVAISLSESSSIFTYIMWDFWWVVHLYLAHSLVHWNRFTFKLAFATSVVEIIIVVTKFYFFLQNPTWDIWRTNWFINKVFVLTCFVLLLPYLFIAAKKQKRENPA